MDCLDSIGHVCSPHLGGFIGLQIESVLYKNFHLSKKITIDIYSYCRYSIIGNREIGS